MPTQTVLIGSETGFTVTNVNSLANNQAKPLPAVDNSANKAVDFKVYVEITLPSSGVSATGTIEIYLIEGTESTSTTTDWTDGIDPAGSANIASSIKNAKLLRIYNANANNQVVRSVFDLLSDLCGSMLNAPKYWALVIYNKCGATLPASGHEITYSSVKYEIT